MPFYEGIGSTMSDKLVIVLDLGAAYTKLGFTGEFAPRCIVRSEVVCSRTGAPRKIADYRDAQDLHDMLVDFLHMLYFKHALFSPKDRSVVLVESLLCPTLFRETLVKVLFCYYEVASVFVLPSHLVSLCTLAIETALVLDVGYSEAVAIPVCHGVCSVNAWQALPLGSSAVHSNLRTLLSKAAGEDAAALVRDLPESVVEDIKVRCCVVTTMQRSRRLQSDGAFEGCPPVRYPLGGRGELTVSGRARETAFDVLFEEDNDCQSVASMVLDAILRCPRDLRRPLAENILLVGGTVMSTGFKARLRQELYDRLQSPRYQGRLHVDRFRFHVPPAKDNYTAWLGGAIYGCTDFMATRALTRDRYLRESRVPDWPSLLDNKVVGL